MYVRTCLVSLILGLCLYGAGIGFVMGQETIVDNSTVGYYNSDLGTVLDGTDEDRFPPANTLTGDNFIFSTEPDLTSAEDVLGDWLSVPFPAPNEHWSDLQIIPTYWSVNTETAIVYPVDAGGGYSNLSATIGIDNGIHIWINGEFRWGARQPSPKWFYDIPLGTLEPGLNFVQVLREDSGGGTYYSLEISGEPAPLPGTKCSLAFIDQEAEIFELAIRNQRTGLSGISATSTNADVEISSFDYGSTEPVSVVISKVDAMANADVHFEIEDLNSEMVPCDWADVVKEGNQGLSLEGISQEQYLLTLHNGTPGFKKVQLTAEGETLSLDRLSNDAQLEADISRLLTTDDNSIQVRGFGPPGTSATLLIPAQEVDSQ